MLKAISSFLTYCLLHNIFRVGNLLTYLAFISCNAEQSLRGMEFQEKEVQED